MVGNDPVTGKRKHGRPARRSKQRSKLEKQERKALAARILQQADPTALPARLSARQTRKSRIISLWLSGGECPEIAATLKLSQTYVRSVIKDAERGVEEWEVADALRLVKSSFLSIMDCHRMQTRELLGQFARTEQQRDRCLDWLDRLAAGEYVADGGPSGVEEGIDLAGMDDDDETGPIPTTNARETRLKQAIYSMSSEIKEADTTIRTILNDLQKGHAQTVDVLTRMGVPGGAPRGDNGSHTPSEIPLISAGSGVSLSVDEVKRLQVESLRRQLEMLERDGEESKD